MSVKYETGDLLDGGKGIRSLLMDGKLLLMEIGPVETMLSVDLSDPDQVAELLSWIDHLIETVHGTCKL